MKFIIFILVFFMFFACEHRPENVEIIYKNSKTTGYKGREVKAKQSPVSSNSERIQPLSSKQSKPIQAPQSISYKNSSSDSVQNSSSSISKPLNNTTSNEYHTVKSGETYYSIARLYGINVKDLMELNNYKQKSNLFVGDKIKLTSKNSNNNNNLVIKPEKSNIKQYNATLNKCENGFISPILSRKLLVNFGDIQAGGVKSDGLVFEVSIEEPVKVTRAGEVVYVGDQISDYGNVVILKHNDTFFSIYGYLKNINIQKGTKLKQGDIISYTSKKEGKFYFAIRKGKTPIKPSFC